MFYLISNHRKLFYIFLFILTCNLSTIFFNNYELFKKFTLKINFISSEKETKLFETYKFTILNKIKSNLGEKYKFRNYKISGPNFSEIEFYLQSFKNQQKTDYIKSKTFVTFLISSNDKENLLFIKNQITQDYPILMNYLNNFKLYNFISLINDRITLLCETDFLSYSKKKNLCIKLNNQFKGLKEYFNNFDLEELNNSSLNKENKIKILKQIKLIILEIKNIIENENELASENSLYSKEMIKIIDEFELISHDQLLILNNEKRNYVKYRFEITDKQEKSFYNKFLVYFNLIILLAIFTLFYLKNVFKN